MLRTQGQSAGIQIVDRICGEGVGRARQVMEAVRAAVGIGWLCLVEESRGCLELIFGIAQKVCMSVLLVLVEAVLGTGLVWYGASHSMYCRRGYKVLPVVVVVGARFGVEGGWQLVRVERVEGVGQREEVVELLVLHVAENGLAIVVVLRGGVVEEVVCEGVCSVSQ